jgi:hypothetical protein
MPNNHNQPNTDAPALAPAACSSVEQGQIRIAPDGTPFRVWKAFRHKVRLSGELGGLISKPLAEVSTWEVAEIPKTLKKGELLFYGVRPIKVVGFERMGFGLAVIFADETGFESMWPASQGEFYANMIYRRNDQAVAAASPKTKPN